MYIAYTFLNIICVYCVHGWSCAVDLEEVTGCVKYLNLNSMKNHCINNTDKASADVGLYFQEYFMIFILYIFNTTIILLLEFIFLLKL